MIAAFLLAAPSVCQASTIDSASPSPACAGDTVTLRYTPNPAQAVVSGVQLGLSPTTFRDEPDSDRVHVFIPVGFSSPIAAITVNFSQGVGGSIVVPMRVPPTVNYSAQTYCALSTTPVLPSVNPGNANISFSLLQGVIGFNSGTGQIFGLGQNQPANLVVIQWTEQATCSYTGRDTINVIAASASSFSYGDYQLCGSEPNETLAGAPLPSTPGYSFQVTPSAPGLVNTSTGTINPDYSLAGTYVVTFYPSSNACFLPSTRTITIWDDSVRMEYPQSIFCSSDAPELPQQLRLPIDALGGSFRCTPSPPPGAFVNGTGRFDPSPITGPASYQVFYLSGNTDCPDTIPFDSMVVVRAPSNATFSYPVGPFCNDGGSIQANLAGATPGGSFSCLGLLVDAQTGELDPSSSLSGGSYIVTYSVTDPCPATHSVLVEINDAPRPDFYYGNDSTAFQGQFCSNGILPGPFFLDPPPGGGSFTLLSGGATMYSNGQIDPSGTSGNNVVRFCALPVAGCGLRCDTFTVVVTAAPESDFQYADTSLCPGESGLPTVASAFQDNWTITPPSAALNTNTGELDILAMTPQQYTVTHVVGGTVCPDTANYTFWIRAVDSTTQVIIADSSLCEGDTIHAWWQGQPGLQGYWATNPVGQIDVLAAGDSFVAAIPVPSNYSTYAIQFRDYGYCGEVASATVSINSQTTALLLYPNPDLQRSYCENDSLAIFPETNNLTGSFSAFPTSLNLNPLTGAVRGQGSAPGDYTITFNPNGQCLRAASDIVRVFDAPDPGMSLYYNIAPDTICDGDIVSVDLLLSGGHNIWVNDSLRGQFVHSLIIPDLAAGDSIRMEFITTLTGCSRDTVIVPQVFSAPQIWVNPPSGGTYPASEFTGFEIGIQQANALVAWQIEDTINGALPPQSGQMLLQAGSPEHITLDLDFMATSRAPLLLSMVLNASSFGCRAPLSFTTALILPEEAPGIFVPGVFTPNGDGYNDTWQIEWIDGVDPTQYYVQVYNDAGAVIRTFEALSSDWTGDQHPDGVYRYAIFSSDNKLVKRGGLTIKRSLHSNQ